MSTASAAAGNPTVDAVKAALAPEFEKINKLTTAVAELREKAAQLGTPHITKGKVGQDSKPYSLAKMAAYSMGLISEEEAKYEIECSTRLKSLYKGFSFHRQGPSSWLAPMASGDVVAVAEQQADDSVISPMREMALRVKAFRSQDVDYDEIEWHRRREKALNTLSDTDGGIMRGPAALGDLIDLQRNLEVFARAGAQSISLPPNGKLTLPKQTNNTVAYYEGEGFALTSESQPKFGGLDLVAKKLFVRTTITNDMMRFVTASIEAMVRADMATQAALAKDKRMLEGAAGTKAPRGILTYGRPGSPLTQWQQGLDWLIEYTAGTVGTDGNTLKVEDVYKMTSKLPDVVQQNDRLKFIGRFDMYAALANRRNDAAVGGDGAGAFTFAMARDLANRQAMNINGAPYVGSSQVSNTRVKGSGTNLTYLLAGDFSEWIDANFGVAEFLSTNVSDATFDNDTTKLRMIQYGDAGPRHASSFVVCDSLVIA